MASNAQQYRRGQRLLAAGVLATLIGAIYFGASALVHPQPQATLDAVFAIGSLLVAARCVYAYMHD